MIDSSSFSSSSPSSFYSSLVASSSLSSTSSLGNTLTFGSNLSCYVCTTIDDIRCKFINETNKHLFEVKETMIEPQSERYSSLRLSSRNNMRHHEKSSSSSSILSNYDGNNNIHDDGYADHSSMVSTASNEILDVEQLDLSEGSRNKQQQKHHQQQYSPNSPVQSHRIFGSECLPAEQYCMVRRLGVSSNSNSHEFNFFALQRSCASQCTPGCFIIGNGNYG